MCNESVEFVEFVELAKQEARNIKQSSLPDRGRELKGGGEAKNSPRSNVQRPKSKDSDE